MLNNANSFIRSCYENPYTRGDPLAPESVRFPQVTVENIVLTATASHPFDIPTVHSACQKLGSACRGEKRVRIRFTEPTAVAFDKSVVVTGAKSQAAAVAALQRFQLEVIGYDQYRYQPLAVRNALVSATRPRPLPPSNDPDAFGDYPIRVKQLGFLGAVKIENVVVTVRTGLAVTLDTMKQVEPKASYDPGVFPGLILAKHKIPLYLGNGLFSDSRTINKSQSFFTSGSSIITGNTDPEQIYQAACKSAHIIWMTRQRMQNDHKAHISIMAQNNLKSSKFLPQDSVVRGPRAPVSGGTRQPAPRAIYTDVDPTRCREIGADLSRTLERTLQRLSLMSRSPSPNPGGSPRSAPALTRSLPALPTHAVAAAAAAAATVAPLPPVSSPSACSSSSSSSGVRTSTSSPRSIASMSTSSLPAYTRTTGTSSLKRSISHQDDDGSDDSAHGSDYSRSASASKLLIIEPSKKGQQATQSMFDDVDDNDDDGYAVARDYRSMFDDE